MVHSYLLWRRLHHCRNTFLLRLEHLPPEACRDYDRLRHLPYLDLRRKVFLKHRATVHHNENYWSRWTLNCESNVRNPSNHDWIGSPGHDYLLWLQIKFWELRYLFLYSYRFAMRRHGLWFLQEHDRLQFDIWNIFFLSLRLLRGQLSVKHMHGYCWGQLHPSKVQEELLMAARWWSRRSIATGKTWIIWQRRRSW